MTRAFALVAAGGVGSRFELPFPKQFAELEGESVLTTALINALAARVFDFIVLAVPEKHADEVSEDLFRRAVFSNVAVLVGGGSRRETIERMLEFADSEWSFQSDDTFSVVDANRPLTSPFVYRESVRLAGKYGFACPIIRISDGVATLGEDGNLLRKIGKKNLVRFLTPETARWGDFMALPRAIRDDPDLLGVAEMCLKAEKNLSTFAGDAFSLKLTHPEDWATLVRLHQARTEIKSFETDSFSPKKFARKA